LAAFRALFIHRHADWLIATLFFVFFFTTQLDFYNPLILMNFLYCLNFAQSTQVMKTQAHGADSAGNSPAFSTAFVGIELSA